MATPRCLGGAMVAPSSLPATVALPPPSYYASSFSAKPQSLSSALRCSSPPASLRSRASAPVAAGEAFRSEQTLDATEVDEKPAVAAIPLDVNADADKFIFSGESAGFLKRPIIQISSSQIEVSSVSQQKVVIRNTHGENLVGILHEAGSWELVVLCHGFRSSKESKTIMNLADVLVSENVSVFRFDFAGNGDSDGSFQYGNYWREVEDLRAIIQYFSRQNRGVHAIVGHSKGGNVVLLYASKFHDISTVVNISGRFTLERGIDDRLGKDFMERMKRDGFIDVIDKMGKFAYRVTEQSLIDRLTTDMHAACLSIDKNCRVLTVHGSEDDIVPPEDASKFDKLIMNHKLHIIEGADHRFISHQFHLARILLEFIRPSQDEDGAAAKEQA
ncbi:hypothetical protein C4D60_Mb07t01620 [Musa balbisiana]|uniref:Serine aminopeptidase S33 domain-containing protein n=1 Tax=Musa balbisiana TaxID=52838 RepID=A0A4S8JCP0_MUSBA|nr:hypothetical protein C4D60_Mb07t01620 [Musa balbisiana]